MLFDFENAPLYSPLPIDLTVGGITAHLSATGQGYSIQSTTTAPVVPVGFSGRFLYPSSIYAADLLVSFSTPLTDFSILYAPQELGCDSSATMRVTAVLKRHIRGNGHYQCHLELYLHLDLPNPADQLPPAFQQRGRPLRRPSGTHPEPLSGLWHHLPGRQHDRDPGADDHTDHSHPAGEWRF